ncbi:Alkyldihydroxyacetonephosphate synthase AgpS [Streptomyces sp. CBMAI 2042]|uniref:FAD-binding oxidoreductase n=1 Tax=Streptomyces sp. CBMAI 2042 TaxID=2305222 RepID=UPI000F2689EC|nr:FAD-binding oxidoreductase [Streptomyces sp. CBMAI 2042]RLV64514.1 Alkyldihydroxyacetonephosphate synthase AgpS [Streptomyces sp. CBMAI 2042]
MADRSSSLPSSPPRPDSASVRSWWGWGALDQALPDAECVSLAALVPGAAESPLPVPSIASLELPAVRVNAPAALAPLVSSAPADRAAHTYGKAFRDVVRALYGDMAAAPDLVARPREERDVVELLDWAAGADVAVVPYGAGSSVVGGVEYRAGEHSGVLSLDLSGLDRVLEMDRVSRAARIQAGVLGPDLEARLRPHGLTLRHFPQSFAFSTLGGWLATRAGGHYATLHTHIDDLVESLRVVTPSGVSESLRVPGSGAGPSPDRLFLGSEGTLGIITEAWMRLQDRPSHKASASVVFERFGDAVEAVRAIAQSGLHPANCRLLDPGEAALSGVAAEGGSVLVLGVESAHGPVEGRLAELVALAREHGGSPVEEASGDGDSAAGTWRSAFLRMPYLRDGLARMSVISETFETACTWDRFPALYEAVHRDVGAALRKVTGGSGLINCRFTHVYPDGPAPYFTVIAPGRRGAEVAMWDEIKAAAMEVLGEQGATVTHHHAVGRDHRPGYDRQRPEPFALALRAAKQALDPAGILNPGVLFDAATA